jgi:cytochrome c oxidase assembly protein subunit 15
MGWYMVKSGLVDDPRVSHLRLTMHLGLAFLIFAAMFWVALDLLRAESSAAPRRENHPNLARSAVAVVWTVFAMVLTGGLVAGIRAGFAYNTFPLMNGHFVPPEILMIEPWYLNFFNNMATVQFDHRMLALLLAAVIPALWVACRRKVTDRRARSAANCVLLALALQATLGIATLLLRVPVPLAAGHQAGAVLLFASTIWLAHALRR